MTSITKIINQLKAAFKSESTKRDSAIVQPDPNQKVTFKPDSILRYFIHFYFSKRHNQLYTNISSHIIEAQIPVWRSGVILKIFQTALIRLIDGIQQIIHLYLKL